MSSQYLSDPSATHPILVTPRIRLRPIVAEDIDDLHAAFADPETMRYSDFPPAQTEADSARYLSVYLFPSPDWHATWSIVCRLTGAVMGLVNYHHRENWNRRVEVGFMLGRPYWKRGLMGEALGAVIDYSFDHLDIERVEATICPENESAVHLLCRLGFLLEGGPMRHRQRVGTEFRDLSMYGLLRDEWEHTASALAPGLPNQEMRR